MTLTLMMLNQSSQNCHFLVANPSNVMAKDVLLSEMAMITKKLPMYRHLRDRTRSLWLTSAMCLPMPYLVAVMITPQ